MAAIDAANFQGPDLWRSITHAGLDAVHDLEAKELAEMERVVNMARKLKTNAGEKAATQAKRAFNEGTPSRVFRAWGIETT